MGVKKDLTRAYGLQLLLAFCFGSGCEAIRIVEIYPVFTANDVAPESLVGAAFIDVSMADDGMGLVLTAEGLLARSLDHGVTWVEIEGPGEPVTDIAVVSGRTAMVVADDVYQTTDGGETWTLRSTSRATHIDALPSGVVAFVTDHTDVYSSSDSGSTFTKVPILYYGDDDTSAIQLLDDTQIVIANDDTWWDMALQGFALNTGSSFRVPLGGSMTSKDVVTGVHLDADTTGVVVTADGKLFHRGNPDKGFGTFHFHTQPLHGVVRRGSTQIAVGTNAFLSVADVGYGREWQGFLGPGDQSPVAVLRAVDFATDDSVMVAGEGVLWRVDVTW